MIARTLSPLIATALFALPVNASAPRVVTDLPVTESLVAMIMEGVGTPERLLDPGADPHDFQLRPSQARSLAQADLVIWMGGTLSPWMTRALGSLHEGPALELLTIEGTTLRPFDETQPLFAGGHVHGHEEDHGDHDHDHAHDDDHAHGHGHEHDHADIDPHAWLDPANPRHWLEPIAQALAGLDPVHAETYLANAAAAGARIEALEDELDALLAPARGAGLVVYHDAYGYLARRFGLNVLGSIALGDAANPGAARLGALRAALVEAGAVCIFPEVNHPDAYVALATEGASLRVGRPLDPAGVTGAPGAGLYPAMMRDLATAIADCIADD